MITVFAKGGKSPECLIYCWRYGIVGDLRLGETFHFPFLLTQMPCSFKVGPKDRWCPAHPVMSAWCLAEDAGSFGAWEALDQLSLAGMSLGKAFLSLWHPYVGSRKLPTPQYILGKGCCSCVYMEITESRPYRFIPPLSQGLRWSWRLWLFSVALKAG